MRRIAEPSLKRKNSSSDQANHASKLASVQVLRAAKSGTGLIWAYLFQGQANWQSSQP
jgi:hypothetical protein